MPVSHEVMDKEGLPIHWRDYCAHLLIPLRKCRIESFFLPWTCEQEKHVYERCEYVEFVFCFNFIFLIFYFFYYFIYYLIYFFVKKNYDYFVLRIIYMRKLSK